MWMFSSLRVCRSFSIVGKQQDGAMESSQTKGNAPCAQDGVADGGHDSGWGAAHLKLQEKHLDTR